MNITILTGAPSSSLPSSSQPAGSDAGSFARLLEQATGQPGAAAANPQPTATTPTTPDSPGAASPASVEGMLPALATTAPLAAASAVQLGAELLTANATPAPLPSGAAAELPTGVSESPLEEIRRRMALIEQAGQLPDTAAVAGGVAPMLVPTNPASPTKPTTPGAASPTATAGPGLEHSLDVAGRLAGNSQTPTDHATAQHGATNAANNASAPAIALAEAGSGDPARTSASSEMPTPQSGEGLARSETLASMRLDMGSGLAASSNAQAGNPAVASLSAPLASRDWQAGLGQQLIGLHQRGEQHIELHLHPAELGPLSVSLKLTELGAQAQFLSSHPQVRAAVEQALPQLREALAAQGISLGETSVGGQSQPQRDGQAGNGAGGLPTTAAANGDEAAELAAAIAPPRSLPLGQVDLYA
ncbi:flagellar hook-length control protein FliK [Geopseudomonas sagittaria]|uniref:Flagellar hook-length control protein FliK n=1 Tax=Geopseudomonas sagittaria TaxID=1135990 RepID=A0A1I5QEE2_9GAMM|nr:flagellar hook-length control protein FliK [Pseudomonas sagittaria]SFP44330.1 flagellar hook-length control protein FliK [Pseudomonas sagittaria]